MTATILKFPPRGPFAVHVEREGAAWLVVCRSHGCLHGSRHEARRVAEEIACAFGVAIKEDFQ